jgi:hypothetical protein
VIQLLQNGDLRHRGTVRRIGSGTEFHDDIRSNAIANYQGACVQRAIDPVNDLPKVFFTRPLAPRTESYDTKLS